ncbi:MAG: PAS domain-containing protein [Actinomycetota bacterium]|nr:PAS domain-containing protein [Actinomycetota bacterium]
MNGRETAGALSASLLLDSDGRILEGNRDAEVFLEKPLEEVRKAPLSVANPALYAALKELLAKTRRGRGVDDYALAYKVGKRLIRLNVSASPYPMEALGTTGTLVTLSSMGARRTAERAEVKLEKQPSPITPEDIEEYTGFLDTLVEPAFILDMEANFIYLNPEMSSLMGHSLEDILGRPLSFFLAGEEAKEALESLVEAARAAPWKGELEFRRGDGTTSHVAVTIDLIEDGEGKPDRLLVIGRDYSEEARVRREREEELRRVWSLLERVGVAVASFTPDLRVTLLSHLTEELLGTTGDRAIGTPFPELFPERSREEVTSILTSAIEGEEVKEAVLALRDKEWGERILLMDVRPAVLVGGKPREYMIVLREATRERSEAEKTEALLNEALLRTRFLELALRRNHPDSFLSGCLDLLVEGFESVAGLSFVTRGDTAIQKAQRGLKAETEENLRMLRLRPGYSRVCELLPKLEIEIHGGVPSRGWEELRSIIEDADKLQSLLREERWSGILILPLRDERVRGAFALVGCDPRKVSERDDAYFASLSRTVSGILARLMEEEIGDGEVIDSGVEIGPVPAEDREPAAGEEQTDVVQESEFEAGEEPEEERREEMEEEHTLFDIAREAKGVEDAEDNLSLWGERVAGRPFPSPKGLDLQSFLWELKERLLWDLKEGEIFLELEEDLPKIHTDPRMLRDVLVRLLDNAVKYSPRGSPVILGAERWGDEVLLRIEDQGSGIPQQVIEEVMQADISWEGSQDVEDQMRYSSLYICRQYVVALGGNLTLKGRPDEGTTAFVRLRVLPFLGEGL